MGRFLLSLCWVDGESIIYIYIAILLVYFFKESEENLEWQFS